MAEGVFVGKALIVGGALLGRYFRKLHVLGRRNNGKGFLHTNGRGILVSGIVLKHYGSFLIFAEAHLGKAKGMAQRGPYQHISQAGAGESAALGVRVLGHGGIELGVIVDAEIHARTCYGLAGVFVGGLRRPHHLEVYPGRLGVIVNEVHLGEIGAFQHHFLGAIVFTEHLGVHEHGAGSGGVEPAQIQHRLRLARADEMPFAVGPGFYPGVVIVRVGPARRVHLAGGDAHGAQGGHAEGGLLSASAQGIFHQIQRGGGAGVGRLVSHLLMAPVVHLQDGLFHGKALHAGFQFLIEHHAGAVQLFVVHAKGQHKVTELALRHVPAHLLAGLQGGTDRLEVELRRVVRNIGQRHIGIQELQGVFLLGLYAPGKGHERFESAAIGLHAGVVILNIILFRAREQKAQGT